MNRINQIFQEKDKGLLSLYFCAGHPTLDSTADIIKALEQYLDRITADGDTRIRGVELELAPNADEQLVKNLKLMHNVMTSMNNENAYYSWIYVFPDEPSEDDFIYTASDADEYKDCEDTFYRLFKKYAKDGLYRPTEEEKQFAFDACKKLGIPQIEVLN